MTINGRRTGPGVAHRRRNRQPDEVSAGRQLPSGVHALLGWSIGPWPDYGDGSAIEELQVVFADFNDEPFCVGFIRPD